MDSLRKFKLLVFAGVFAAAFLLPAAPGYSWTHDEDSGRHYRAEQRGYYSGYHHHPGYYEGYRYSRPWRGYHHRPYHHYYYGPSVSLGVPYPYAAPGFSVYIGP